MISLSFILLKDYKTDIKSNKQGEKTSIVFPLCFPFCILHFDLAEFNHGVNILDEKIEN